MDTGNQSREFTKEDSYRNLERVLHWISNYDLKMLALVGIFTIFIVLLISSDLLEEVLAEIPPLEQMLVLNLKNGLLIAIVALLGLLILLFVRSMILLLEGLGAKINQGFENKESFLFFGSIADKTYGHFRELLETISTKDIVEEIDSQMYIHSILCLRKMERLKKGIQALKIAFVIFFVLIVLLLMVQILY